VSLAQRGRRQALQMLKNKLIDAITNIPRHIYMANNPVNPFEALRIVGRGPMMSPIMRSRRIGGNSGRRGAIFVNREPNESISQVDDFPELVDPYGHEVKYSKRSAELVHEDTRNPYDFVSQFTAHEGTIPPNFPAKITIYNKLQLIEPEQLPISQYVNDAWLREGDFDEAAELTEEEQLVKIATLTGICEQVPLIMNESMIEEKDLDQNFKDYIKYTTGFINYITGRMFDNYNWTFDPMDKFTWVYLMSACKYEQRAIRYLLNSPYFKSSMITKTDIYGSSCLLIALRQPTSDIIAQLNTTKTITAEMFTKMHNEIPTILNAVANVEVYKYVISNIPNISQYLFNTQTAITPLIFACEYSPEVAQLMINSEYMTQKYFEKSSYDLTVLTTAACHSPQLLKSLLESKYCTQELVEQKYADYGNVLHILAMYYPEHLKLITDSQFMKRELIVGNIYLRNGQNVNILSLLCHNPKILKDFLELPYIDESMMNIETKRQSRFTNQSLLFEAAKISEESLDILLSSKYCTPSVLALKNGNKENILHYLATYNPAYFLKVLQIPNIQPLLLDQDATNNRTPLMIALANPEFKGKFPDILNLLTPEILNRTDKHGFNLLCYFCHHEVGLAGELIANKLINSETMKNLQNLLCCTQEPALATLIIDSEFAPENNDNVAMEVLKSQTRRHGSEFKTR
jgi:hypothetical protein